MFSIKSLLLIFLLFSLSDCNSTVKIEPMNSNQPHATGSPVLLSATDEIPKDLEITLNRTACYGTCPIYALKVSADGSVSFEGERFTKTEGKAEAKLSDDKVRQLINEFEKADYFNLNGEYDCYQSTDSPSAITSIQINGKKKSIDHYFGCEKGTPEFEKELSKLKRLENKIDEIAGTKIWVGQQE